jgi:organic hydroperoxide reductase OsmC/OhrA
LEAEPVPAPLCAEIDAAGKRRSDASKAKELIEKAEANCLISNSMKTHVTLVPTIR